MELPDDVLRLVRDFSRPITRPDWRDLHLMSARTLHEDVCMRYNLTNTPVIQKFIFNYGFTYDIVEFRYRFRQIGGLHLWSITEILSE
jgi:hypothetical protein